jgi:hypothetical protein
LRRLSHPLLADNNRTRKIERIATTIRPLVRTAFRPLVVERSRFLLNVGAASAAVSLILLFQGFEVGLYQQLRLLPEQLPTPLVALQTGVTRLGAQRSVLPSLSRAAIEAVPGVRAAHPVAGVPLIYENAGRRTPVYVIAYDTAGAPRRLVAGRQIEREREIVVDSALASKYGLAVGSEVEFVGAKFRIVGLSTGTASMLNPYVFARYVDLVDLYRGGELRTRRPPSLHCCPSSWLRPSLKLMLAASVMQSCVPFRP